MKTKKGNTYNDDLIQNDLELLEKLEALEKRIELLEEKIEPNPKKKGK